ncbi:MULTISPECIES: hypothetical protein [Micromonospora]|uniref:Uncharacterized protein n=1 Tax=Micromonospora antibiotica TaxID=2807623 RepID=A0ABS3VA49_9ACTN|nr:hypothetical protein [Micromonospora antibiotica]MBO4162457.1 hypothetical protein [Micromonospora antibiotica]
MDTQRVIDMLERAVFTADERVRRTFGGPALLGVETAQMGYEARPADWAVARESWVDEVIEVVGTNGAVTTTVGLLFPRAGAGLVLNSPATMAALGRRVGVDLDPVAYAELLAVLYSGATLDGRFGYAFSATPGFPPGWLIRDPDHFRTAFPVPSAPPVGPPTFAGRADGSWTLRFWSHDYHLLEALAAAVDVHEWEVTGGPAGPASWSRRTVGTRLPLA